MRHVPRFLRFLALAVLFLATFPVVGCASAQRSPEQAYIVNAQGATSPTARSALAGSTAPGKQEILGLYIPFIGTGLAIKAGLEYDGTPTVIEVPIASAPQAAAACESPQFVEVQRTVMVPETYTETKTRMVPRTVTERRAVVPIPRAAEPCAPVPQAAPQGCPEPPPAPVACGGPECAPPGGR